jgi:prepilin-type N-terminal cleavage/methylation domain-containing protein/prepilin-type processing-associated H-X9-DG protein
MRRQAPREATTRTAQARLRRGISLTELLVVLAIIAILVALLLPAVLAAREAARRSQCTSQMRQLGLGVQNFESTHGHLPPSNIWRDLLNDRHALMRLGVTEGCAHSWPIFFFPFLEQSTVAERYSFKVDACAPMNRAAREAIVPLLQCPSSAEPSPTDKIVSPQFGEVVGGVCDYVVCSRLSDELAGGAHAPFGVLLPRTLGRFASVTDGLSNTLLFGEDAGRQGAYVTGRRRIAGKPGSMWAVTVNTVVLTGHSADGLSTPGPCAINCNNRGAFYSFHPGGMNVCYADGSTHFLEESIDLKAMAALVTRGAGD